MRTLFAFILCSSFFNASAQKVGDKYSGIASYYADYFHGRTTASGEIFSQDSMTAASRTLPFGTIVRVTNQRNDKSIVVKINDRGPFVDGRIIDLSYTAAEQLDFIAQGLTPVTVEIVGTSPIYVASRNNAVIKPQTSGVRPQTTAVKPSVQSTPPQRDTVRFSYSAPIADSALVPGSYFAVQVGSFGNKDNANRCLEKLKTKSSSARISEAFIDGKTYFRVSAGAFATQDEAMTLKKILSPSYPNCFLVTFEVKD